MDTFDATDQCCNCLKKHVSEKAGQKKTIQRETEVEAITEQMNIDNVDVGFILCNKCKELFF